MLRFSRFEGYRTHVLIFIAALLFLPTNAAAALGQPTATFLTTGATHACAVVNYAAKCWGKGQFGALGNDSDWDSAKPATVVSAAAYQKTTPGAGDCDAWGGWFGSCSHHKDKIETIPATGMGGKPVTKISAGADHTCAIASAKVYCWGHADNGRLGNGDSIGWKTSPVAVKNDRTSALYGKEVVDVSAGDSFTCALASDGTIACWGKGADGRLGTNSTSDKTTPTAVYAQGAMNGQKGRKLAKASGSTMCVIVTTGAPYCWGYGIDDGRTIPANASTDIACDKSSPTNTPSTTTTTTVFSSTKPVAIPGATITAMDGQDYVTGLGTNGQAYYWGVYGYEARTSYTNTKSCRVNPCTGAVTIKRTDDNQDYPGKIVLTGTYPKKSRVQQSKSTSSGGGSSRPGPGSSSGGATKRASSSASTDGGYTNNTAGSAGGKLGLKQGTTTSGNYTYTRKGDNVSVTDRNGNDVGSYDTRQGDNTKTSSPNTSNGGNGRNCNLVTHYGFTRTVINTPVGQKVTATPPSWPQSQSGIKTLSGNVYSDLFCAATSTGTQCDGHGSATTLGQLGNGKTTQLSGSQSVVGTGWLAGKQITQLSTGSTGYTCAIASGSVGCWGVNTNGVLGVNSGDWYKTAPTGVGL